MLDIPYGYCRCGCGNKTNVTSKGANKYVRGHNSFGKHDKNYAKKENHHNWKGGIKYIKGYRMVYRPGYPKATKQGYVLEHILIVETVLGRLIPEKSIVHHADQDRANNENSNLVLCEDIAYHKLIHLRMRAAKNCGHVNWRKCKICKEWDDPKNLYIKNNTIYHRNCIRNYNRKFENKRL